LTENLSVSIDLGFDEQTGERKRMEDVIEARIKEVEEREQRLNKRHHELNSIETRQKGSIFRNLG